MPLPRRTEIRIGGLGGQGVVLTGHILGKAAVNDGLQVVQTQSYGAEARGSAAKSEIILSDEKIGFPMVRRSDVLVAMSQTALGMHLKNLKETGTLIVDTDTTKEIPATAAKVEECVERLQDFIAAGCVKFVLRPACPLEEIDSQIEAYGRDILPHFA